jgi:recombination protein RecT
MANELALQQTSTLANYLNARKSKLAALGLKISPDRLILVLLEAASRNPKLLECTPESVYATLHTSGQLGLQCGGPLGHSYPVPFMNNKTGKRECALIIGYKGMIQLVRQSEQISTIYAYAVRKGDDFKYELGLNQVLKHIPTGDCEAEMTHAYAVCHFKDGGYQMVVMTAGEIDKIRRKSKQADGTFWTDFPEEMWKKTALRRLCKYLPMKAEYVEAILEQSDDETVPLKHVDAEVISSSPAKSRTEKLKESLNVDKSTGEIIDVTPVPAAVQAPITSAPIEGAAVAPPVNPASAPVSKRGRPAAQKKPETTPATPPAEIKQPENTIAPQNSAADSSVEVFTGTIARMKGEGTPVTQVNIRFKESTDEFFIPGSNEPTGDAKAVAMCTRIKELHSAGKQVSVSFVTNEKGENIIQGVS